AAQPESRMVIPCDFCFEKPQSAEKIVSLTCEASLCQAHLRKHNSKPTPKDHVLVPRNAGGSLEARKCLEHAQLLEYFCQDDLECFCATCSAAHKDHSIVALRAEYGKQMIKSQIDKKEKQILGDIQSSEKKQLADIIVLRKLRDKAAAQSLLELQARADQTDACLFLKDFYQAQDRQNRKNEKQETGMVVVRETAKT
ncbi:hypothetical protein lerEdw1_016362, partial [Lerista edwardsae]